MIKSSISPDATDVVGKGLGEAGQVSERGEVPRALYSYLSLAFLPDSLS